MIYTDDELAMVLIYWVALIHGSHGRPLYEDT
jgi:hypothetical protein